MLTNQPLCKIVSQWLLLHKILTTDGAIRNVQVEAPLADDVVLLAGVDILRGFVDVRQVEADRALEILTQSSVLGPSGKEWKGCT